MRALIALFVVLALGACKDQMEKSQADISKGNPEGGIMKKQYEEAQKAAAERRKEAPY